MGTKSAVAFIYLKYLIEHNVTRLGEVDLKIY